MQNHKNIIKKLIEFDTNLVKEKDIKKYYFQLLDLSKRIWESLENQKEMVEVLNSTNESMLNYHISDIMKTLTIFSVIVFPLTLFAAVFGMNTVDSMPFVNSPFGFWYIVGIMLVASLLMLLFFERKNWLK
jgi:magnesium transporter